MKRIPALMLLAGAMLLTGCAALTPLPLPKTPLKYSVQENLVTFENPRHDLVRIGQFVDKRSAAEKKGTKPRFWFALLGWWRIGTYVTPDSVWTDGKSSGNTAAQITNTVKECVEKSNFFKKVEVEKTANPSGGEGLILTGEINSLKGTQEVKKYFYFLIVYFKNKNQKFPPKGYCKITYRLIDAETNQELKSNTIESNVKDPKMDLCAHGAKALEQAETLMINEVTTRALLDF